MSKLLEKIKSRGYWQVTIRPNTFNENLIETLARCKNIIQEVQVSLRGWSYPFYDYNKPPTSQLNYIEFENEWTYHLEYWRYYQNGMFVHFLGMREDWQDQAREGKLLNVTPNSLAIISTLYQFTEIYEFAARLANKNLLTKDCTISINLIGTQNRKLIMLDPSRIIWDDYICMMPEIPRELPFNTADLIAQSSELSLEHTLWLFERFNWNDPPRSVLKGDQEKLLKGLL